MKKLFAILIFLLLPLGTSASVLCDNSVNGWASTAGGADTTVATNGDLTIAYWVKTTTAAADFVVTNENKGDNGIFAMNINDDVANRITIYIFNFNTSGNTNVNDGAWHSVVLTRVSNTTTVYTDKSGGTTGSGGHTIGTLDAALVLCKNNLTGVNYYDGRIAKFAFYNSVGWSQTQVNDYHDSGGVTIPSSPQVVYTFPSTVGLLLDTSGNSHTLVPNGTGLGFTYDTDEPAGSGGGAVAGFFRGLVRAFWIW